MGKKNKSPQNWFRGGKLRPREGSVVPGYLQQRDLASLSGPPHRPPCLVPAKNAPFVPAPSPVTLSPAALKATIVARDSERHCPPHALACPARGSLTTAGLLMQMAQHHGVRARASRQRLPGHRVPGWWLEHCRAMGSRDTSSPFGRALWVCAV